LLAVSSSPHFSYFWFFPCGLRSLALPKSHCYETVILMSPLIIPNSPKYQEIMTL
jgi:hypothetical protein